jgi:hypothetical protein
MTLSDRDIRVAGYVVGEEIRRRTINGWPVPSALRDVHASLLREVESNHGQVACQNGSSAPQSEPETARQVAARYGVHHRTVRRHPERYGGRKVAGRWIFEQEQP